MKTYYLKIVYRDTNKHKITHWMTEQAISFDFACEQAEHRFYAEHPNTDILSITRRN